MPKIMNAKNEADIRLLMKARELSPEFYREMLIRAETVIDVYKAQKKAKKQST